MSTSLQTAMPLIAPAFARAMRDLDVLLPIPSASAVNGALVTSYPPGAESTTAFIDISDASFPLSFVSSCDGDRNDMTKPTLGLTQLMAGFAQVYQMVTTLVVQSTVITSDIVSLKDRVTAIELAHGRETEALKQRVSELLHEQVASQEDRVANPELSQRTTTDSCQKMIQELTTKVDDDRKSHDDALENLRQSFKNMQMSMECQSARITGVKADTALKIALLQSELGGVKVDLAAVKTVAVPATVSSVDMTAKDVPKAEIPNRVVQRVEDAEMVQEKPRPPLPAAIRSSCAIGSQDAPKALPSGGCSSIPLRPYNQARETTVNNMEIKKEPFIIAPATIAQPGASKIPALSIIPGPKPTIPTERHIPTRGNEKENNPCNSSTTVQPGAGQTQDVRDKLPEASMKAQPGAGVASKISGLPQPRRSMVPAPRKSSQIPSLAGHGTTVGGSTSNEVKTAVRLPGRSGAQTKQPKTVRFASTVTSTSPSKSSVSRKVEKETPVVLPPSSSLTALDAALQALEADGGNLLTLTSALDYSKDDLSFSVTTPIPTQKQPFPKNNSTLVSPGQLKSVDVKRSRSPLKSTPAVNEASLPASSSLAALDAALRAMQGEDNFLTLGPVPDDAHMDISFSPMTPIRASSSLAVLDTALEAMQGQANILTLTPGPDHARVNFSFSSMTPIRTSSSLAALDVALHSLQAQGNILTFTPGPDDARMDFSFSAMTPMFPMARLHCELESIYVSPMKTSVVKPSRRL